MTAQACGCLKPHGPPKLVVLTGGPGAGKTAILQILARHFCDHVVVLPEAASLVFGGGFPRHPGAVGRRAAQRAMYRIQRELERMFIEEGQAAVILCDRGAVDGVAYWPGPPASYFADVGTTAAAESARYAAVIHLRTPSPDHGYDHSNPIRIETPAEAARLDERIAEAWDGHPNRRFVPDSEHFFDKLSAAAALVRAEVPACCPWRPIEERGAGEA